MRALAAADFDFWGLVSIPPVTEVLLFVVIFPSFVVQYMYTTNEYINDILSQGSEFQEVALRYALYGWAVSINLPIIAY